MFDRRGVAPGASAGNAGWISPAMVAPLPEPSVLRYGLVSLLRPASPLRIPPGALPATWRFLAAFAAHCTRRQWLAGVAGFAGLNSLALSSYQKLAEAGVAGRTEDTVIIAAFDATEQAGPLRHELQSIAAAGGLDLAVGELDAASLRREQPLLGSRASYGLRIGGQRILQPLDFVQSLAASVRNRGGQIITQARSQRCPQQRVPAWNVAKPLVDEAIDQDPHLPPRAPCRAAVDRAGRQGLPQRRRPHPDPVPGTKQARLPERGQPRLRPATTPGERANAQLKTWRILRKLRCCPGAPGSWPRPSTSFKPTRSQDEKGSLCHSTLGRGIRVLASVAG